MHVEPERVLDDGLSRRQLLTRGAIAGGLVWAAPVIRTTAAYATTANGTERPCINFYMVVIGPSGQVRAAPGDTQAKSVPPAIRQWFLDNPSVRVDFPSAQPQLTSNGGDIWAVLLPGVTGPNAAARQCRMVHGWGRKGNSFAEGYIDPNPPIAVDVGLRLLFPCPPRKNDDDSGASAITGSGADSGASTAPDAGATADSLGASSADGVLGSDGAPPTDSISSDGNPSHSLSSDGRPSTGATTGPGACIDAIYLIYCCPR